MRRGKFSFQHMPTLSKLRDDTPGCACRAHLNNAGSSLPPVPVLEATRAYLEREAQIGGYETADERAEDIAGFYASVATLLHASPRNIAFAGSATDAYARALSAIPFREGDCVLTTENDYSSNQIAFLSMQKRLGIKLFRARDLPEGGVDIADFERLLRQYQPVLAAVTHVPTNSGLVQPVEAIGEICRRYGTWYLVDACQSAGQMPLDVQAIGCDFLSATMRKYLRGPRGAGFLYVSDKALDAGLELLLPDIRGAVWSQADAYETAITAQRFEYWEKPYGLMLGSRAAVDYALQVGLEWASGRINELAALTRAGLSEIPGMRVLDQGEVICGIVSANSERHSPGQLMEHLQKANINCRTAPRAAAQIDLGRKGADWILRVSPHYYNTEEEISRMLEVIRSI
jgi:selenocysteine lyase/cysteine desulfurase